MGLKSEKYNENLKISKTLSKIGMVMHVTVGCVIVDLN